MLPDYVIRNNKVDISIVELEGRSYIVYMKAVGSFKCYIEDFETGKRASSEGGARLAEDALRSAYENLKK